MNTTGEYFSHCHDAELKEVPFHYKRCGLENIYLLNGFEAEIEDGERYVSVLDVEGLHQAIGVHLVNNRKILSPNEVRFLRKTINLTQAELGRMIGQSGQQVARWEKGENKIPGPADRLLRLMFLYSVLSEEEVHKLPLEFLGEIDDLDSTPDSDLSFSRQEESWLEAA
jgi:DNA-binding transcriptional regulator YiaG